MGNLRFQFGSEESAEYMDAPVVESEYVSAQRSLVLVVTHSQFDRMILRLEEKLSGNLLEGDWSAATMGAEGRVLVEREL